MSRSTVIALLVGVIALTPLQAVAVGVDATPAPEPEPPPAASAPAPAPSGTPLVLRSDTAAAPRASSDLGLATKIGACALIVGAAVWAFKRRRAANKTEPGATGSLALLSRLSLGARTEVCVVEVDGQRLVLGITPQSIRTLSVTGIDSEVLDAEPAPVERAPEPRERERERVVPAAPPARPADVDDRIDEEDAPRVSRRDINQTGVQRISRAPHEGLLKLFERTRSLSRSGAEDAEPEAATERERRTPVREPERAAASDDRPAPRRAPDDAPRARSTASRVAVEGQARGLASLRAKR
ncbi:MAG: flagellar biosynthetic protein FliO [Polyangiaceae bacterium]